MESQSNSSFNINLVIFLSDGDENYLIQYQKANATSKNFY